MKFNYMLSTVLVNATTIPLVIGLFTNIVEYPMAIAQVAEPEFKVVVDNQKQTYISDYYQVKQIPKVKLAIANSINSQNYLITNLSDTSNSKEQHYFTKSPHLIDYATTNNYTYVRGATYYFTITIPEDAGTPLQKVTLEQREGVEFMERYHIDETRAFEGTRSARGEDVSLGLVTTNRKNRTITVPFDSPISPGKTVTIALRPIFTPRPSGVYLLRVTAFPPGVEESNSLSIGVARFHFYGRQN